MVREVIIAPKGVNAAANIGSVNILSHVLMEIARVDIRVGRPEKGIPFLLPLRVRAVLELVNTASQDVHLTVGFPVSNSQYSKISPRRPSCRPAARIDLEHLQVSTSGERR